MYSKTLGVAGGQAEISFYLATSVVLFTHFSRTVIVFTYHESGGFSAFSNEWVSSLGFLAMLWKDGGDGTTQWIFNRQGNNVCLPGAVEIFLAYI